MALQDVHVEISLVKPAVYVGFGKPLIITEKTGASTITHYTNIDDVVADFAATTEAYLKAATIFEQENRPLSIAIATYDPAATDGPTTAAEAVDKYFDEDWVFALTTTDVLADQIAVADLVEGKRYKFYIVQTTDAESRNAFLTNSYNRVINFYHPNGDEHADAALVGENGTPQVGTITWKFKTLKGLTPIDVTAEELKAIHADGAIAYVTKAGEPQTSEGFVVSGEYIDTMHGRDWVKFTAESRMQKALKDNPKIAYDNNGIALFESIMTSVLEEAARHGIVDKDESGRGLYTVTALGKNEIPIEDRHRRVYNGLSFTYEPESAIHEMTVTGSLMLPV